MITKEAYVLEFDDHLLLQIRVTPRMKPRLVIGHRLASVVLAFNFTACSDPGLEGPFLARLLSGMLFLEKDVGDLQASA